MIPGNSQRKGKRGVGREASPEGAPSWGDHWYGQLGLPFAGGSWEMPWLILMKSLEGYIISPVIPIRRWVVSASSVYPHWVQFCPSAGNNLALQLWGMDFRTAWCVQRATGAASLWLMKAECVHLPALHSVISYGGTPDTPVIGLLHRSGLLFLIQPVKISDKKNFYLRVLSLVLTVPLRSQASLLKWLLSF